MQSISSLLRRRSLSPLNRRALATPRFNLLQRPAPINYRDFQFRAAHATAQRTRTPPTQLSPSMAQPTESFGNYDLIKRVKLDFTDVVISKWQSRVTGLTIIHLDYEGTWIIFEGSLKTNFNGT